jgi:hypothetical protein
MIDFTWDNLKSHSRWGLAKDFPVHPFCDCKQRRAFVRLPGRIAVTIQYLEVEAASDHFLDARKHGQGLAVGTAV